MRTSLSQVKGADLGSYQADPAQEKPTLVEKGQYLAYNTPQYNVTI